MIKKFKYQIILFVALLAGAIILQSVLSNYQNSESQKQQSELEKRHHETVLRIETGIDVYATLVSSIRAYVQNSADFPTERQLQHFISDLIDEIDFKDSMVVSWIDTNHIFRYVVTPYKIDPIGLKGTSVKDLRPDVEIEMLNALMLEDTISLYKPINLIEGWAAFPFNFSARNSEGEIVGYIAPVVSVNYLFSAPYKKMNDTKFIHRFTLDNNVDVTREAVYDGSKIYNSKRDPEYYQNYLKSDFRFIYSTVNFYGLKLRIGTAYMEKPANSMVLATVTYLWYVIICMFSIVTLLQYLKNNQLNESVKLAHSEIVIKNEHLSKKVETIQILIKEVHHRVKNNMQIMSSLMNLQSNNIGNKDIKSVLEESRGRIQSMALVHQKLYLNENLSDVDVHEYVEQLISYVENTLGSISLIPEKRINISPSLFLNIDTMIPLALIINEMVTNSFKYAFNQEGEKWIELKIEESLDGVIFIYGDSGPGIPTHISPSESNTLGLELIYALTEQLDGVIHYDAPPLNSFTINFKRSELS